MNLLNDIQEIRFSISREINNRMRIKINRRNRERLINKDFSLIANTCNGGVISHDLGLRFNSPFVNLWLYPKDFIKYLQDMDHYINSKLVFYPLGWGGVDYPVARLDDIDIYFMHYKSKEDAEYKWTERTKRINKSNLFVILAEKDGCTRDDMVTFESLKVNKVILTHTHYSDIKSSFYIKGFEDKQECGILSNWERHKLNGRRYLDQFDFVSWFNGTNSKDYYEW